MVRTRIGSSEAEAEDVWRFFDILAYCGGYNLHDEFGRIRSDDLQGGCRQRVRLDKPNADSDVSFPRVLPEHSDKTLQGNDLHGATWCQASDEVQFWVRFPRLPLFNEQF